MESPGDTVTFGGGKLESFRVPDFDRGELEFLVHDDEICIYGTPSGIVKLCELMQSLVQGSQGKSAEHIHLEDYELLTPESMNGVVAVFRVPTG